MCKPCTQIQTNIHACTQYFESVWSEEPWAALWILKVLFLIHMCQPSLLFCPDWLTLKAFLCLTWQPDMCLHAPSIRALKANTHAVAPLTDCWAHLYIHTNMLTHTHTWKCSFFPVFTSFFSFSVTYKKAIKKKPPHVFLTCCLTPAPVLNNHIFSQGIWTIPDPASWHTYALIAIINSCTDTNLNSWAGKHRFLQQWFCCAW